MWFNYDRMKMLAFLITLLVFVTSVPNANSQGFSTRILNNTYASTSKIIRFFGDSYVRYDFNVLPAEMLAQATKESLSFTFITQDTEGLMWMFKTAGYKMHISMKEGSLLFVIDDGLLPQQVVITSPNSRPLNDFRWHSLKIDKEGKVLKFYMDEKYVTQLTARANVQFVARGEVDLGGTPLTKTNTGGLVETNFDGALTDVECRKFTGPSRELIISFLQFVESASQTGDIEIFDRDRWNSGNWSWNRFTTTRAPPTPSPKRPTPVTFTSATSAFFLRDPLDMRTSGSVGFRFRTLEPRGLLTLARGSAQGNNFVAIELFDGILYFVYNFGSYSNRKQFATRRVDDGEWHEVRFESDGRRIYMTLDGMKYPINLKSDEMMKMYFYRLFIGGYAIDNMPWPIYSRMGYRGCLASLEINDLGVDLHSRFRDANANGVEVGCRDFARFCQTQPCSSGACKDRMGSYMCNCANTPFSGTNCDTEAAIASWDGTKTTNYEFVNRDVTHTNDLSFRFMTPLADTLLFKTEVSNSDDYIKAELVGGRVKVTIKVGTEMKSFFTGNNVNDYFWHTLYIRRRANDIEVWVDEEPRSVGLIDREDFNLQIDRLIFGSLGEKGSLSSNNYIGYMQNFMYDDIDVFSQLRQLNSNVYWITGMTPDNLPLLTYKPVTVTTNEAHFKLPYLRIGRTMKILFKFKTRESNGLILYNSGVGNDVIAIELSNGQLRLAYNLGGRNMFTVVPTQNALNDNQWHTVQVALSERGQFSLRVDGETMDVTASDGDNKLTLRNTLFIGGLPEEMYQQPAIRNLIESRKGFRGCLASMDLNGAVPDLLNYATDSQQVLDGCTDIQAACKPNACGPGACMPMAADYWCDCNMTGYTGIPCTEYPVGYYFGRNGNSGMVVYEYPFSSRTSSNLDRIAFGFMTKQKDGVLYRVQGTADNEYIEIRIENGFIVAESNTGGGKILLQENSRKFNDGSYHVVRYIRTGSNSTLQVDQLNTNTATHTGTMSLFDKVHMVMLGGRADKSGAIINKFNGIMGGAYYNGYRWFDMLLGGKALHGKLVKMQGDVLLTKPFILIKGGGVVKPTPSPPDIYIPPDEDVADLTGGGGVIGPGFGGPGSGPPGVIGIGGPGGLTGLPGGVSINVPGQPVALASAGGPAPPPMATGARAGAVVGTVIGTLAFMSSLMWALYKLKPGVPTCLSPGAGSAGAGAGGGGMSISSPRATSNIGAVQAVSAGSGGGGGGAGAGAGKVTVVNGSASAGGAGAGAGGGGSSTYTSYFQSTSTSVGGGGGAGSGGLVAGSAGSAGGGSAGMDQFDSATLRATGTFSNKGTAIGTPKAVRSNMGSSSSSYAANYQTNTMQSYGSGSGGDTLAMGGGGGGGTFDRQQYLSASSANDGPDYDLPVSGTMQSGNSYSSSTLNTHYNYQVSESFSNPRFITSKDMFVTGNTTDRNNQSVLAVVAARNTTYLGPVRYEVYTTTLRPDTNQAYVDRAEDLVIEQAPDIVTRKSRVTPNDVNIGSGQSQVTIQTGSSAFAKYQAHTDVHDYVTLLDDQSWTARNNQTAKERQTSVSQIDIDISPVLKTEAAPQTRKSSLQITPKYEAKVGEYVHLESYSSETNINAKSGISSLKRTDKSYSTDASLDNLYESTTTITSTVRSDSIENNLFSLNEEETPGGARTSSGRLDLLMASLDDIGNSFVMIDETNTCGDELHGDIYAKVNKTKQSGELQASSIEMKRMNFATSCMAEIRDDHTDSSITETLIALDGTNTRNELMPDANLSLTFAGAPTRDRQTDRTENVIEHDKQTITKPPRKLSKPTINISEFRDADKMTTSFTFDIAKNSPDVIRETNVTKTNATKTNVIETNAIETKWNMNFTETKKTDYSGEEFNTLQEELDKSVNELLAGIDLDTSEWTAVKDITSLNGSSAGTAETDDWEVQNLKTVTINRQGQYVMSGMSGTGSGAVTPGAAGDEVRVDCCLMTTDGRSVVTGSSLGPPQVWDMQTGELQNIMKGDSIGSTNLHLVCGDRLMVGAVHADMEINEYSGRKGVFNHTLQIWDFSTGKPLSMAEGEYCSAMCPMSDSDKVLFGRTDKYGDATSVIAWDLLGNQAIKEMRYDAPVGNNDYISYLNLSNNDRYVVAGFTNSFDNQAEFMVFDMTLTSYNISEPAMLKLDANPECTAILPRDEAVTGLRNGDLVIWSIRTGQPSRQLMGGGGAHAHGREVKSVTLSKDGQYLVSTSADGTAKVWDMHTERPIHTLSGHTDEVWCSAVSTDNEIVATGSNDGTIRLWRMKNGTEMCVFNCGVDIFFLTMSHDKGTIVALGDKFGARKLIMLQVVRTKIKKIVSS